MAEEPSYEQIIEMARELKELLENHLLENPEKAAPFIDRARQIRQDIESWGLMIGWKTFLNPETLELSIEIDILEPKDNMTPDEQKLYDEWFLKKAGVRLNSKN